jgi:hypothetical protein
MEKYIVRTTVEFKFSKRVDGYATYTVTWGLKDEIVRLGETSIASQRLSKHVLSATNTQATIKGLLKNGVFCCVRPEAI